LKGKFVLTAAVPEKPERFEPQAHRYTDAELASLPPADTVAPAEDRVAQFRAQRELSLKIQKFLIEEGVAAWIEPSRAMMEPYSSSREAAAIGKGSASASPRRRS